jgi:hypothetical protein
LLDTVFRARYNRSAFRCIPALLLTVLALACILPQAVLAESPNDAPEQSSSKKSTAADKAQSTPSKQAPNTTASAASISGTVIDQEGAVAVGAQVQLIRGEDQSTKQETVSGDNGQYSFSSLAPGPFRLTLTAPGFDTKLVSGELHAGEAYVVPPVALNISAVSTEVSVTMTPVEVAQEEVHEQLQQKVLGFIPNYYVTYNADAAPLFPKQKFYLAWKSVTNPVTIGGTAMLAGIYQASDTYSGYGQGAEGYAKRLGATYANVFSETFIGSAILPSLLKQDPRYFYRGTGTTGSRLMYAFGNSVMCKGDNKKWQVNYSTIAGSFAAGAIGYAYYPASDRSWGDVVENSVIRIAESGLAGVFQEFVLPRFTSRAGGKKTPGSTRYDQP